MTLDETTDDAADESTSPDAGDDAAGSEESTSDDAFVDPSEIEDYEEEDESDESTSDDADDSDQDDDSDESDEDSDDEDEAESDDEDTNEDESEEDTEDSEEEEEESDELKALLKDKETVNLLKKLKIDPKTATLGEIIQAISKNYWGSVTSSSKTVRELRAQIEQLQDEIELSKPSEKSEEKEGEEQETKPEGGPEVQRLTSKIKTLEDSKKQIITRRAELKKKSEGTRNAVIIAQHELKNATEENRTERERNLQAAISAHNALADQDEALSERVLGPNGIDEKLEDLQDRLKSAKQADEDRKAQEEQTRRALHQKKKEWRNGFEATVAASVKSFKVDEADREDFKEIVKAMVTHRLRTLQLENPNRPAVDLQKLTNFVAQKVAKTFKLTAAQDLKKDSKKKLQTLKAIKTSPKPGSGKSPKAKPSHKKELTWEQKAAASREHAARILRD